MEQLKIVEYPSELIRSKMTFLIEQTELALMHNMHRRYSPDFALDLCTTTTNNNNRIYFLSIRSN